jgi:hypothetical protein
VIESFSLVDLKLCSQEKKFEERARLSVLLQSSCSQLQSERPDSKRARGSESESVRERERVSESVRERKGRGRGGVGKETETKERRTPHFAARG